MESRVSDHRDWKEQKLNPIYRDASRRAVGELFLHSLNANVLGQIKPGIPVWQTGAESKFPYMPYIIFPGNVGTETTLREIVEDLDNQKI